MTQLPPEQPDADALMRDWQAMLAGQRPTTPQTPAPASQPVRQPAPHPSHPVEPAASRSTGSLAHDEGRQMTRREAREAEQRRAAAEAASAASPTIAPTPSIGMRQPDAPAPVPVPAAAPAPAPAHTSTSGSTPALAPDAPASAFAALLGAPDRGDEPHEPRRKPTRAERRAAASLDHHGSYEHEKPRRRGGWGCLVGLVVVAALGVGAFFFLQGPINAVIERFEPAADYEGQGTGEVVFMIHEGDTGESIATNLVADDVVASEDAFLEAVTAAEPSPIFYPGAYRLAEQMSAQAALDALEDPANKLENTFVIPEGTVTAAALPVIAEGTGIPLEDLEAAAAESPQSYGLPEEAKNLEGFLFPATYTLDPDADARTVLQSLVDRQFQALDEAGVAPADRWRTVIVASLVQREAGLRDDYYRVARVIENRLDPAKWESGLLQFDSTVHYGIGDMSVVTTTDEQRADTDNPFNTYVHPGLTPTPISNPGDLAIDAAVHPADGPWLYFVTWNLDTGETIFSETLDEHEAAVAKWQAWMAEHPEYG